MWSTTKDTFEETIDKLNNILKPINIKANTISWINGTKRRVPSEHCVLTFKNKKGWVQLLCQSHLLKGKTLWIVEELTLTQLKAKASELKKMHEARKQGKWAVYRGGKGVVKPSFGSFGLLNRCPPPR